MNYTRLCVFAFVLVACGGKTGSHSSSDESQGGTDADEATHSGGEQSSGNQKATPGAGVVAPDAADGTGGSGRTKTKYVPDSDGGTSPGAGATGAASGYPHTGGSTAGEPAGSSGSYPTGGSGDTGGKHDTGGAHPTAGSGGSETAGGSGGTAGVPEPVTGGAAGATDSLPMDCAAFSGLHRLTCPDHSTQGSDGFPDVANREISLRVEQQGNGCVAEVGFVWWPNRAYEVVSLSDRISVAPLDQSACAADLRYTNSWDYVCIDEITLGDVFLDDPKGTARVLTTHVLGGDDASSESELDSVCTLSPRTEKPLLRPGRRPIGDALPYLEDGSGAAYEPELWMNLPSAGLLPWEPVLVAADRPVEGLVQGIGAEMAGLGAIKTTPWVPVTFLGQDTGRSWATAELADWKLIRGQTLVLSILEDPETGAAVDATWQTSTIDIIDVGAPLEVHEYDAGFTGTLWTQPGWGLARPSSEGACEATGCVELYEGGVAGLLDTDGFTQVSVVFSSDSQGSGVVHLKGASGWEFAQSAYDSLEVDLPAGETLVGFSIVADYEPQEANPLLVDRVAAE